LRFLDQTHLDRGTPCRTAPNEWPARRRGCYLLNKKGRQEILWGYRDSKPLKHEWNRCRTTP